jgi:hypothetical protein
VGLILIYSIHIVGLIPPYSIYTHTHTNGEVSVVGCLSSLLAEYAYPHVGLQDHADVVGPVACEGRRGVFIGIIV